MELKQQLSFCKQCENRKFDPNTGIVCSLTLRKPDFLVSCKDFSQDPKEAQKMAAKASVAQQEEASGSGMSAWSFIVIGLIVVRIIIRLMRD